MGIPIISQKVPYPKNALLNSYSLDCTLGKFYRIQETNRRIKKVIKKSVASEIECIINCEQMKTCLHSGMVENNVSGVADCVLYDHAESESLSLNNKTSKEFISDTDDLLLASNICFGAKGNSFATFTIPEDGVLKTLILTHVSGKVTCTPSEYDATFWGCKVHGIERITTIISTDANVDITPQKTNNIGDAYVLPGFNANSAYIAFNFANRFVKQGDILRIWYLEDFLKNGSADDNVELKHCVNVYGTFK